MAGSVPRPGEFSLPGLLRLSRIWTQHSCLGHQRDQRGPLSCGLVLTRAGSEGHPNRGPQWLPLRGGKGTAHPLLLRALDRRAFPPWLMGSRE